VRSGHWSDLARELGVRHVDDESDAEGVSRILLEGRHLRIAEDWLQDFVSRCEDALHPSSPVRALAEEALHTWEEGEGQVILALRIKEMTIE